MPTKQGKHIQIIVTPQKRTKRRDSSQAWIEKYNPLRGLSIQDSQWIFDAARAGNYSLLHWIFSEIERTDPILMTCVERRTGAISMLGPKSAPIPGTKDQVLAQEQCDMIDRLCGLITNLPEALEHLDLAFFRGFAHVMPLENNGRIELACLNSWNFCQRDGAWFWNPDSLSGAVNDLEEIDSRSLVTVQRSRMIDYPAMAIFLRSALAEKDWGRFIERYGLPPCIITLPQVANEADAVKYQAAAEKVADGLSGALPNGSAVSFATEARGTDPFTAFVEHQQKLTVLLSTGGTLTSLAEAGTGTLAGNAQMSVWDDICKRDAAIIGSALNRSVFQPALRRLFPGKPICANFELQTDQEQTPAEIFDIATKARAAGYLISQADLEAATGYKLEKIPDPAQFSDDYPGMPLQNVAKPLQNAVRNSRSKTDVSGESRSEAILRAFADEAKPAGDAVMELIESGMTVAAAERLANRLNSLLPTNPKSATLIAEEVAGSLKGLRNV